MSSQRRQQQRAYDDDSDEESTPTTVTPAPQATLSSSRLLSALSGHLSPVTTSRSSQQQQQHAIAQGGSYQHRLNVRPTKRARFVQLAREAPVSKAALEATGRTTAHGTTFNKSKHSKGLFAPNHMHIRDRISETLVNGYHLPSAFEVLMGRSYEEEEEERQRRRRESAGLSAKQSLEHTQSVPFYTRECVYCHQIVSIVGGDFWAHLGHCNAKALMDFVSGNPDPELLASLAPTDLSTPLQIAQRAAIERYIFNSQVFASVLLAPEDGDDSKGSEDSEDSSSSNDCDRYDGSPTDAADDSAGSVDELQENRARRPDEEVAQHLQSMLDRMTNIEEMTASSASLPNDQSTAAQKKKLYESHVASLYKCTTQAEIAQCLESFRSAFPATPSLVSHPLVQPKLPPPVDLALGSSKTLLQR